MPRTGVILLCVHDSALLRELASPLCPYHDVYICADRPGGSAPQPPLEPPSAHSAGTIRVAGAEAEAAGYRGTVSWLPDRASSRCKALFWLARVYAGPIDHWWLLEEDVLVPTEATLLALDARLPGADLITPNHQPRVSRRLHWSGHPSWPHWKLGAGLLDPPLYSSMVCGMRLSRRLVAEVDRLAARRGRLAFCELLFNTLAARERMRIHTPPELAPVVWRNPLAKLGAKFHPALLYHPIKDLAHQRRIRQEHYETAPHWRAFADMLLADGSPAALEMDARWAAAASADQPADT